ncbi:MAG: FCD domain-containing protein [Burkholderiaceae bacterium]|nr:FCD domain-containing protein [Burkholderiaceae bacterium]
MNQQASVFTLGRDKPPLAAATEEPPRTLFEATYRQLRRDIIHGLYLPNDKLRVEHLKAVYKVSGGTLREALALLVSDSLVVSQGQRGFRVAPMSLADLQDLTRTRVLLECASLRESMAHGGDAWEAAVVSTFHRLSLSEERLQADAAGAFDEWEARNREFHDALVSACPSPWLERLRSLLYQQTERYRRFTAVNGPPPGSVHEEHREIFEAAIQRNAERAVAAMELHINRALTIIRSNELLG